MAAGGRIRPNAEERKQTTATFGEMPAPVKRDESPIPVSKSSPKGDNKPKLFKGGGTNPFAKRTAGGGFGGSTAPS